MSQSPIRSAPIAYQLRIAGHLDQHWAPWFGDLTLTHEDDGTTSLTGAIADQAELHGVLTKICLLYTSPSPRDLSTSRMPSSA